MGSFGLMDFKKSREIRKHIKNKEKLLIDRSPHPDKPHVYINHEHWTTASEHDIYGDGYYKAINFKDEIAYYGAKVFVRFDGFNILDTKRMCYVSMERIREGTDDDEAEPIGNVKPNYITSSSLYSFYCSEVVKRFMDGMTRISFAPIDTKMLILVGAVVVGLVLGMAYFLM